MESEIQILNTLQNKDSATQRDIAKKTGLSLGSVNILIKRLVRKGFLKVERLNARTIRYILTPEGLKERAEASYKYILNSYRLINHISSITESIITGQKALGKEKVALFGENDEIALLLSEQLNNLNISSSYVFADMNELQQILAGSDKIAIIVWNYNYANLLHENNIEFVNLLERIPLIY